MPQADAHYLLQNLNLAYPLIGVYDAPEDSSFPEVITLEGPGKQCLFRYFPQWVEGKTLKLSPENYGCGGCGHWFFGINTRSRDQYIEFLGKTEGLRADEDKMGAWFDQSKPYQPTHNAIFVGPLHEELYPYLKTVLFFADPDQLSILSLAAYYHAMPEDPPAVIAPFGSGCMQSLLSFPDLSIPQAAIGATDLAMRQYLPPNILMFSCTRPMYERMASLDEHSFLGKAFLKTLKKARNEQAQAGV